MDGRSLIFEIVKRPNSLCKINESSVMLIKLGAQYMQYTIAKRRITIIKRLQNDPSSKKKALAANKTSRAEKVILFTVLLQKTLALISLIN